MTEKQKVSENQDSIKVSQGASGKFSYEVKRYYDSATMDLDKVIDSIKRTYDYAKARFEGE